MSIIEMTISLVAIGIAIGIFIFVKKEYDTGAAVVLRQSDSWYFLYGLLDT